MFCSYLLNNVLKFKTIKFFLTAIKEASQETLSIVENVMKFKEEMENKIRGEFKGSSENPIKVLKMLFEHPVITANSCKRIKIFVCNS